MKPVLRYQSQLLYRRAYKPARHLSVRPGDGLHVRPVRVSPWRANAFVVEIVRAPEAVPAPAPEEACLPE